ncbi:receptor-type protein tyrosine kinase [Rhodotorula toruloides]|uniref:Receptor-type protein tyrosine kinase n=1 Tax=Rhodotorula toruloides TaxID=5286 RepID=A0A511KNV0_RHOTO|nr:receptor-type protein tyrosine kinase [Rhodotorula toruloides]
MQPLIRFAADSEQEKKMTATKEALEAWGGLSSVRHMIIIAVNNWEEAGCDFRRGRSDYATAWLDYATKVPETLHVQPGLNTPEDRIHLTLPALTPRLYSIATVHMSGNGQLRFLASIPPTLFTTSLSPPSSKHSRPTHRRRDIQMYLWQYDVQGYQVSGAPEDRTHVSNPPRTVHSNLTAHLTSSNLRPTLPLGIIFDLDYVHPVHASGATSLTVAANEVVARSSGAQPPRL